MKSNRLKNSVLIGLFILTFILGRESKSVNEIVKPTYYSDTLSKAKPFDSKQQKTNSVINNTTNETIVYRCGKSKVYHPTTSHASFKRCKSKVYELTVKQAKSLGLRRCRCKR